MDTYKAPYGGKAANREGSDYYASDVFAKHRNKTIETVLSLPHVQTVPGWVPKDGFAIGGLEYIGFSDDSNYLLVVSSGGRGVIDLACHELVARDDTGGEWLNEPLLLCEGIGPLAGKRIRVAGMGGGGLPTRTGQGDSLYLAAPLYPCYDVVYQPAYRQCLVPGHNEGCAVIHRGFVICCGFSWSSNVLVVVDEDLHLWYRNA